MTFEVTSTQAGVSSYIDNTVEAHRTYQYRIRARGAATISWSVWTEYVFSGAQPQVDLQPPTNVQLTRDASTVGIAWTAPAGDYDNYTLQRQELVVAEGSTFFANVVTLNNPETEDTDPWLPNNVTTYTDAGVIPSQIYEYRLAAVKENLVRVYTDWFRVGPPNTALGGTPGNFKLVEATTRVLTDRMSSGWLGMP